MYYAFILNPAAGSGHAVETMNLMEQELRQQQIDYRIFRTERQGHATDIARELSADNDITAVISVGGDGTAFEVANGLAGTGKAMGIIPSGTGNDFIKSVGLPRKPMEALQYILTHQAKKVDMGRLNDGRFLNVCGTGFDVTVLDYTESFKKRFRGLTPYLFGLIKAIFHYTPVHLRIETDEFSEEGDYLVCSIANGQYIGGGIPICPIAEPDDGKLDLVLISNIRRAAIPRYLPGLLKGKDLSFKMTRHFRVEHVTIENDDMRLNVDGEIFPMKKAEFAVEKAILNLIC